MNLAETLQVLTRGGCVELANGDVLAFKKEKIQYWSVFAEEWKEITVLPNNWRMPAVSIDEPSRSATPGECRADRCPKCSTKLRSLFYVVE